MEHLVVSLIGPAHPGITPELCKLAAHCNCTIVESRMTTLATEFSASLLITGTWNTIAKFETGLPALEQKYELRSLSKRSKARAIDSNFFPYAVYVIAPLKADVTAVITQFFAEHNLPIYDLFVSSYKAPQTDVALLSLTLTIHIPNTKLIADIRENFIVFCDESNFDAVIEPLKN